MDAFKDSYQSNIATVFRSCLRNTGPFSGNQRVSVGVQESFINERTCASVRTPNLLKFGDVVKVEEGRELRVWLAALTLPGMHLELIAQDGGVQRDTVWILVDKEGGPDRKKIVEEHQQMLDELQAYEDEYNEDQEMRAKAERISALEDEEMDSGAEEKLQVEQKVSPDEPEIIQVKNRAAGVRLSVIPTDRQTCHPMYWYYYVRFADGRFVEMPQNLIDYLMPKYVKISFAPQDNCYILKEHGNLPIPYLPPSIFLSRLKASYKRDLKELEDSLRNAENTPQERRITITMPVLKTAHIPRLIDPVNRSISKMRATLFNFQPSAPNSGGAKHKKKKIKH